MPRLHLKSSGLVVLLFLSAVGLTEDKSGLARPTYFGIKDGEVPEDPRDWGRGRYDEFPDLGGNP